MISVKRSRIDYVAGRNSPEWRVYPLFPVLEWRSGNSFFESSYCRNSWRCALSTIIPCIEMHCYFGQCAPTAQTGFDAGVAIQDSRDAPFFDWSANEVQATSVTKHSFSSGSDVDVTQLMAGYACISG